MPGKLSVINGMALICNGSQVRTFISVASSYHRFIPGFAQIAKPLHHLTKKGEEFAWIPQPQCQQAFDTLKQCLTSAPIVAIPDCTLPFQLCTDVSLTTKNVVLMQVRGDMEPMISYASLTLNSPEMKYSATKRECLGIVWVLQHFQPYIAGTQVAIITDHQSLQ